jgi:hypothetical protein
MSELSATDGTIVAPWTPEQVAALNAYQEARQLHPFTCGNDRGDADHVAYQALNGGDFGQLVASVDGWHCPVCGYRQAWAHAYMASPASGAA